MSFSAVPTESERPSGEVITSEAIGYEAIRGGNHKQSHHEAINFKNEVNIKNEIDIGGTTRTRTLAKIQVQWTQAEEQVRSRACTSTWGRATL